MLVAFPITTVVALQSFNGMRITTTPIVSPNSKLSRGLSLRALWHVTQASETATSAYTAVKYSVPLSDSVP